jgi:hypothetical protein
MIAARRLPDASPAIHHRRKRIDLPAQADQEAMHGTPSAT